MIHGVLSSNGRARNVNGCSMDVSFLCKIMVTGMWSDVFLTPDPDFTLYFQPRIRTKCVSWTLMMIPCVMNPRQSKPKPYQNWPVRDDSGTEWTVGTTIWTWITTKWAEMTRNHKTGPHKQPNVRIPHVRDQFLDYRTTREPQFDDVMNYDVIDCLTCL